MFGSCVAGKLVSTNQGNGTRGPGARHSRVSTR
jgi:hypothetical protein